jgi:RNA polymerase sigma-70 factor (ECF subfamily)
MSTHHHSESCREIFALLSEYLDMALPADACRDVEAHLEDCPPCVEFAESLKKTIELCREYSPGEVPAPLSESSRDALQAAYEKMLAARKT